MRNVFVGPHGLRAGWGFAIFVVLWIAISNGLLLLASLVYRQHRGMDAVDFLVSDGLSLVATLVAVAIMARIERRPFGGYGLALVRGGPARFAAGVVWGFVPVAATMAAIAAAGGVSFAGWALSGSALARAAAMWAVTMIVLGFFEETLFRGYPLVTLGRGMGKWPAAILLSVLFGALHYFTKPMESVLDGFNVALIGLFVCFTFFRTGDLWLAAGFHAAFDYFALSVFGAPNTGNGGLPVNDHLVATTFHGPDWLTGGVCGIEASVPMLLVTLALFGLFAWRYRNPVAAPATSRTAMAESPPG